MPNTFCAALVAGLCLGYGMWSDPARAGTDMTGQMARPLLAYSCPVDFAQAEALCRAFQKALGAAAPRHALRRMRPGEAVPPLGDKDIFVALHIDRQDRHGLAGHVEWRGGGRADAVTGARVSVDVQDATLEPPMYDRFVKDVIRLGAPPLPALPEKDD